MWEQVFQLAHGKLETCRHERRQRLLYNLRTYGDCPMSNALGFALVGCGMIARFHVRALAEIPGTRIAALVSRTPASAAKLLEETGTPPCPVFATVEEAVRAPGVN